MGSMPESGSSLGEGHGNSLQHSCWEKSDGQRSLLGYGSWGCKGSNTTDATDHAHNLFSEKMFYYTAQQNTPNRNDGLWTMKPVIQVVTYAQRSEWEVEGNLFTGLNSSRCCEISCLLGRFQIDWLWCYYHLKLRASLWMSLKSPQETKQSGRISHNSVNSRKTFVFHDWHKRRWSTKKKPMNL